SFLIAAHHVAVLDARKDVNLHVLHARRHAAIRLEHGSRRGVILVAPDDAHRRAHALQLADEVEELRAVAGDAGVVAQALGPADRVRAAVAEADHRGAPVEERLAPHHRQRVGEIALAGPDLVQARLAARRGALVVARERSGYGAPEEVRRGGDVAARSEFVGNTAQVRVDAV